MRCEGDLPGGGKDRSDAKGSVWIFVDQYQDCAWSRRGGADELIERLAEKPVTLADSRAGEKRTGLSERERSAPSAGHLQIGRSVSCGSVEPREAEAKKPETVGKRDVWARDWRAKLKAEQTRT